MGLGKPKAATITFIGAGLANLVLSMALARPPGLAGVALGTAVPNVVFAAIVLTIACRELRIPVADYLLYVVPRAMAGAVVPLAVLVWIRRQIGVDNLAGFVGAGSAMVVVFGLVWVFFVYRRDPYIRIAPRLDRLRAWSRA